MNIIIMKYLLLIVVFFVSQVSSQTTIMPVIDQTTETFITQWRYSAPVTIECNNQWKNVNFYDFSFNLLADHQEIRLAYQIPFTGANIGQGTYGVRMKFRLIFDGKEVSIRMRYQGQWNNNWSLSDLDLSGIVKKVKKGIHTVQIMGICDNITPNTRVYIPWYDPNGIENTDPFYSTLTVSIDYSKEY